MIDWLSEPLLGVLTVILGYLMSELRRKQKNAAAERIMKTSGYPPTSDECKACFFFKEFKRRVAADEKRREQK